MKAYTKLREAQKKNESILCVGLDTDLKKLPTVFNSGINDVLSFNKAIIEATSDLVCAYKLNFAFYEQYGCAGIDVLKKTMEIIPKDIFVIADAKRGDIGNTSAAYAASFFDYFGTDSITVNPYMGYDSVEPFIKFQDKLVFLLVLTSNPGSNDFQKLDSGGKPVYRHVMEKSMKWGEAENIGFVVGATHPQELAELRKVSKDNVFLIPGIGAQGGDHEAVLEANAGKPVIINVSRSIIYASNGFDFAEKAREKAAGFRKSFLFNNK